MQIELRTCLIPPEIWTPERCIWCASCSFVFDIEEEMRIKMVKDKPEPEICEGCTTGGKMKFVDIKYASKTTIKTWKAVPCSVVRNLEKLGEGKINPARLQWCYNRYKSGK